MVGFFNKIIEIHGLVCMNDDCLIINRGLARFCMSFDFRTLLLALVFIAFILIVLLLLLMISHRNGLGILWGSLLYILC